MTQNQPILTPTFDLSLLRGNDHNPRKISAEQKEQLRKNLERHGNVGVLVARKLPDGTHRLISGHQRLDALLALGQATAPVMVVECEDQDEQHLMVTLNGHAGTWDNMKLAELLRDLGTSADSAALEFGISQTDVDAMMEQISGMEQAQESFDGEGPGLGSPIIQYNIVFDTEDQQELWFKFLRWLKESYANEETIGGRLSRHLRESGVIIG